jgi:hypothetical protein
VVVLPDLAFPMQAEEATLMAPDPPEGRRKNISFDPVTGRVSGSPVHAEQNDPHGCAGKFGRSADSHPPDHPRDQLVQDKRTIQVQAITARGDSWFVSNCGVSRSRPVRRRHRRQGRLFKADKRNVGG